jgi:4a-hydroxytetrahydrobiopterin dehydratase
LTAEDSNWTEVDGALERTVELPSFSEAIAFVNRLAEVAERENHHPDMAISYRRVTVRWATHSAGGITDRDRALAEKTNGLIEPWRRGATPAQPPDDDAS